MGAKILSYKKCSRNWVKDVLIGINVGTLAKWVLKLLDCYNFLFYCLVARQSGQLPYDIFWQYVTKATPS